MDPSIVHFFLWPGVGQWSSWQRKVGFEGSSEEEGTTGRHGSATVPVDQTALTGRVFSSFTVQNSGVCYDKAQTIHT